MRRLFEVVGLNAGSVMEFVSLWTRTLIQAVSGGNFQQMPDTAKLGSAPPGVLKRSSAGAGGGGGHAGEDQHQHGKEWIPMDSSGLTNNNRDSVGGSVAKDGTGGGKSSRFQVAKVDFARGSKDENRHSSSSDEDDHGGHGGGHGGAMYNSSYDTHNMRSLHHYTREALPRLDHYRNVMSVHGHMDRPTLDELHNATLSLLPEKQTSVGVKSPTALDSSGVVKLGWVQGVFVRVLLNIWGVILFLRLSWVVGQAGIALTVVIILLASTVTMLTTLSMSAICTNGEVKGGGTYYMISRSLGPEFGGSIGIIFSLANAVAIAMYVVGFAEAVRDVLRANNVPLADILAEDNAINLVRIIGGITCIGILCIALIGTEWESKAQVVLLFILLGAMANFIIGAFLPPSEEQIRRGFVGASATMVAKNFGPQFTPEEDKEYGFFQVFAVFFPAATGILAGANISGDLANPSKAIPRGTFLGILVTSCSYIAFAFLAGATTLRYASGILPANATDLSSEELLSFLDRDGPCNVTECPYGLFNDANVLEMVSLFGPLVNAGVFAATLSSALASLVSAPKVFQALCKDKLFPHIDAFGKGYGPNGEPKRGYFLAMGIGIGCVAIGKLNSIAPLISNFFMAAYCLINFACFHASFARSPGFRPSFRYYNMWLSLLGAILCLGVMFVMEPYTALITFAVILGLHMYIGQRKPDVNWGSSTQAQTYKDALNAVYKLQQVEDHVKNYRPQILVLCGEPNHRPPLIDFAYSVTKKLSLLICGHVARPPLSHRARHNLTVRAQQWLIRRKIKAFYSIVVEEDRAKGIRSLLQCSGVGKLRPNVVMLGYKYQWSTCPDRDLEEYFNIIHEILDHHMSIAILRLPEGLDYAEYANTDAFISSPTPGDSGKDGNHLKPPGAGGNGLERNESALFPRNVSSAQLSTGGSSREITPPGTPPTDRKTASEPGANDKNKERSSSKERRDDEEDALVGTPQTAECPKEVLHNVNQFLRKQRKGTIDVWWLYDDGGLTMLVPYLLSTRSAWSSCKLRVFSLANKKEELDREQRNMAALLSKFRMEYSDVLVIPDVQKPPKEETRREFEKLIERWRTEQDEVSEDNKLAITDSELLALKAKTNRHLRLREFLMEHSRDSNLVVMTLPMPRKNTCSASLYMAWLEMLTKDMPPFLLIRGNQTSVLTFYS